MQEKNTQETLAVAQKAWDGACRVLLGPGMPPMEGVRPYLERYSDKCHAEKSAISGKPVTVFGDYPEGTRFMLGTEINEYEKRAKAPELGINDIKDIDSAIRAASEIGVYAGDIVLGTCANVAESTRVVDSTGVWRSSDVIYSRNVAYTRIAKYCESVFGCASAGKGTKFAIGCNEMYMSNRTFECFYIYSSSDVFYSANIENCQDCLFCFNLRGKRRRIGNLELPADKHASLKAKLVAEMAETLAGRKTVPSIYEIIRGE